MNIGVYDTSQIHKRLVKGGIAEEERDTQGAGDGFFQVAPDHGAREVPKQMQWVIIVLLSKGGGDYHGIGILEPF